MTNRSMSVTETATSAAQKNAAIAASNVRPKARTHAAIEQAVTSSTTGYLHGIATPQLRQRPRRRRYEITGMLSRGAIGVSHDGHADGGWTIDRPTGSRAATTFRKLPTASPGTNATAASNARPSSIDAAFGVGAAESHVRGGVPEHDVVLEDVRASGRTRVGVDRQANAQLAALAAPTGHESR